MTVKPAAQTVPHTEGVDEVRVEILSEKETGRDFPIERAIYDIDSRIDMLSCRADTADYFLAIASGVVCAMLDILWVGDIDLKRGRELASECIDKIVVKTAGMMGCKKEDLASCVKYLENMFPLASDGNTPDFGGGLNHHLRDFAHHPTITGLIFSIITQFTCMSYGTDAEGAFIRVPVPEKSLQFIGENIPEKIFNGIIRWFFHLVSDMAGSGSTAGLSGGTGIPGPFLSLAKEVSSLPLIRNLKAGNGITLPQLLSKLFNGTFLAEYDESGKIIKGTELKTDLRCELGIAAELARQALPVAANECIVRAFYFIRRLAAEVRVKNIRTPDGLGNIDWNSVIPADNPTLARMLTVASGVFTTIDISDAFVRGKYFVAVNYAGIGRFAVAISSETAWFLKRKNLIRIREMYEEIQRNTFTKTDNDIYKEIGDGMETNNFGLTLNQTEILYNLEYQKTLNDIELTMDNAHGEAVKALKREWIQEWCAYMKEGFAAFTGIDDAELSWYSKEELLQKIYKENPVMTWFRLLLLETMLFEPYYPLDIEKDRRGNEIPSRKYNELDKPGYGYKKSDGDEFLESLFANMNYYTKGYVKRLRKCYDKAIREMNEVLKTVLTSLGITAAVTLAAAATAGALAAPIAVALVGSNFAGLSGAALTSACLAYIGGGAVAAGGAGMLGGTITIVGGGTILGLGAGTAAGGTVGAISLQGKKTVIVQSAKLLVSVREIFLNDEHDIELSTAIYEQYVKNIADIEKGLVELELKAEVADRREKKKLQEEIKSTRESVDAMKTAMKSMNRFVSSYQTVVNNEN